VKLTLTRAPRGKVLIEARKRDKLVGRVESKFTDETQFKKAAKALGVSRDELMAAVDALEHSDQPSVEWGGEQEFELTVRDLTGTDVETLRSLDPLRLLKEACTNGFGSLEDPVARWSRRDMLAAVDLDSTEWDDKKLRELLVWFDPRPAMSWVTKSGGLRLVYGALERFSAEECAAVAYLCLSDSVRYDSLELKTDTRLPRTEIVVSEQTSDMKALRRRFKQYSVDDGAVVEWLRQEGLVIGGRYSHDKCPVSPSSTAAGTPVHVFERGVKCFVCEAHGLLHGGRTPGFFPFSAFVGGSASELLYNCLDGFCHWEHAKHVLQDKFGLSNDVARVAYGAALKLHHSAIDDETRDSVLQGGHNVLRMEGRWTNSNGDSYVKDVRAIIAALPSAGGNAAKVATLEQTFDLAQYGYPHLTPVFGCRMYSHFVRQCDVNRVRVVVQTPALARDNVAQFRPKYIPPEKRVDGWAVLEQVCPGIEPRFVKLMLVAKGFVEGGVGLPPMIFVSGPTSSAKTGTVMVSAAIAGDGATAVQWTANIERVRQAIRDSKDTGMFLCFNEFFKEAERAKQSAVQASDFVLNLTPDSTSWKAYIGPVKLGDLPVVAFTDTRVPIEVKQDAQLARRLVHVNLSGKVDWRHSLRTTVDRLERFRLAGREYADAADAILSEVIDEFFVTPTTFEESAGRLGYFPMSESDEAHENESLLLSLFKAACEAPDASGSDATRWSGRGWKVITRGQMTPLLEAWENVADEDWKGSRKASSEDWTKLVGASVRVKFECKSHGASKVAIRFRSDDGQRQGYLVNDELTKTDA